MSRSLRALTWEQWRVIRWPLLAVVICSVQLDLILWTQAKSHWVNPASLVRDAGNILMMTLGAIVLTLLAGNFDRENLRIGFPVRIFRLPMSGRVLATHVYIFRFVAALAGLSAVLAVHRVFFGVDSGRPFGLLLMLFLSVHCIVQGLAAVRGSAALLLLPVAVVVFEEAVLRQRSEWYSQGGWIVLLICVLISAVAGYGGAVWGTTRNRHSEAPESLFLPFRSIVAGRAAVRTSTRVDRKAISFSTPIIAQAWHEWRQVRTFAFAVAAMVFIPATLSWVIWPVRGFVTEFLMVPPVVLSLITGVYKTVCDYRNKKDGTTRFASIRPLTSGELAMARLLMGFGVVVFFVGIAALIRSVFVVTEPAGRTLIGSAFVAAPVYQAALLFVRLITCLLLAWIVFWLVTLQNVILAAIASVPLYIAMMTMTWSQYEEQWWFGFAVLLLLGTAWSLATGYLRGLLSIETVFLVFLLWVCCWILFYCSSTLNMSMDATPNTFAILWSAAVAALAVAPIASISKSVNRRRSE